MHWQTKRSAITVALSATCLLGVAAFLAASDTADVEVALPSLTCFDTSTATISLVNSVNCDPGLLSLGAGPLVKRPSPTGRVVEINPTLQARFLAAQEDAERDGVHLYIASGFRSYQRQSELFNAEVAIRGSEREAAKWVLPARYSHHPQGLALDINYPEDPAGAKWLEIHGSRFGLCRVYVNEWWHFEGVIAPGQACPDLATNALVDLHR